MARVYARRAHSRPSLDRVTLIVLIAFVIVSCITAILAVVWIRSAFSSNENAAQPAVPLAGNNDSDVEEGNITAPSGPLQRENYPDPVAWDGKSRITILVMGLDYRDWEGGDIPRTDSMILASIDPKAKTAGILSIPRDLWVNIPNAGESKINTAYRLGEINQSPGGGPGLAMQTVEEFMGMEIDYYAMIDFNSFVGLIDEMGGLDMHIREEIVVDPIGPGNTVTLEPGVQTLDGATVLAYARQRYTANDDFDRSERQQEVIMAIRQQILQFNMLPTLVKKAPRLYKQVASGISTNLTLDQIVKLALLAAKVDEQNIKRGVMSPSIHVENSFSWDGQSILLANPDQIRILRDETFFSGASSTPPTVEVVQVSETAVEAVPEGDPIELMKQEEARVIVLNGTSTTGLASKTGEMLQAENINVVDEGNADEPHSNTTLYVFSDKPYTVQFLMEKFSIPSSCVIKRFDSAAKADIEIVLGDDWASQQ